MWRMEILVSKTVWSISFLQVHMYLEIKKTKRKSTF